MPYPENISYLLRFADYELSESESLSQGGFTENVQRPGFRTLVILDGTTIIAEIPIRDDMRPIWGRLMRVLLDPNTNTYGENRLHAVVFGWQKTIKGVNVKALNWITQHGSLVVSDRDLDEVEDAL